MDIETRCSFRRTRMPSRRERVLSIRLSDSELAEVQQAAGVCRLAVGAYVARAAVTQARDAHEQDSSALRELHMELAQTWTAISRVGTNVNQLAKVANSTGEVDHARLGPTLSFVRRALARVEETCLQITARLP